MKNGDKAGKNRVCKKQGVSGEGHPKEAQELSGNERAIAEGRYNDVQVKIKYNKRLLEDCRANCNGLGLDDSQAYSAVYWKKLHETLKAGLQQRGRVKDRIKKEMEEYKITIDELMR